jgi:MraZ protein
LVLTGAFEHTIDAKNRLAVPSELRAAMGHADRDEPVVVYVTLGEQDSLCIYPEPVFERRAAELDQSQVDTDEVLAWEEAWYGLARRVELDGQGRLRLPESLLTLANLGKEVVLIGVKDHIRVRDRAAWKAHLDAVLAKKKSMLLNPRRMMRKDADRSGA